MKMYRSIPSIFLGILALGLTLFVSTPVFAQAALPTAPAASRAVQGGLTSSAASLPGPNGASPLEPYLVTWLLPISGIGAALFALYVDRRMRNQRVRP
jgi:hypothetical protein